MKSQIGKKFCRFLKDEGGYKSFINEFKSQTKIRLEWAKFHTPHFKSKSVEQFEEYCESINDKKLLLNFAFEWDETEEGWNYWNNMANKWIDNFETNNVK